MLKAGAYVNTQGLEDDTPLHDAAVNGHVKVETHKVVGPFVAQGSLSLVAFGRQQNALIEKYTSSSLMIN